MGLMRDMCRFGWFILCAGCFCVPMAAGADERDSAWWMLETCAAYFETGQRAAFTNPTIDGELVAHTQGGVCNGHPGCEDADMTFIGSAATGRGAVTVRDTSGAVIGDDPQSVICMGALDVWITRPNWAAARDAWLDEALASGRVQSLSDGRVYGCAWNGRQWHLDLSPEFSLYFRAVLGQDLAYCAIEIG